VLAELEEHRRGKGDVLMLSRELRSQYSSEVESRMSLQTARTGSERGGTGDPGKGDRPLLYSLISEGAFDCLSLPFSFRKDEIFLIPCQTKVRALNDPVKPFQAKVVR
jgi:hypothetical protein